MGVASRVGTLTVLSAPEDAKRDSAWPGPLAAMREPAGAAGAHDTAVTPSGWAFGICTTTFICDILLASCSYTFGTEVLISIFIYVKRCKIWVRKSEVP